MLYTSARAEKQVEGRLKTIDKVEVLLPLHLSPRKWSDRIKYVEVPLFPSYIFVKTTDHILRSLTKIQGVSRIIFHEGKPAVIREKEIKSILSFLENAQNKEISYSIDEEILIACGPLKEISGKIKRIGKKNLVLHVEQLGLTVSIALDQVKKINR